MFCRKLRYICNKAHGVLKAIFTQNNDMRHHLDEKTLELFNSSFEACLARAGFLERFYQIFIESSPDVREKFKATDLKGQARMVRRSLLLLTMASLQTEEIDQELARLGQSHGRDGMGIGAHLYEIWLDSLLQAVTEFYPAWSPQVEDSWRRMFDPYLAALKSYS